MTTRPHPTPSATYELFPTIDSFCAANPDDPLAAGWIPPEDRPPALGGGAELIDFEDPAWQQHVRPSITEPATPSESTGLHLIKPLEGVGADTAISADGPVGGGADPAVQGFGLHDVTSRATITVDEMARIIGLGRTAAYDAVRHGDVPSRRVNGRILIPVPALLNWLGANCQTGQG